MATRTRTKRTAPGEPLPAVEGKFFVRLVRGRVYHLLGNPELVFDQGAVKEVPKATFDHLVQHATDSISFTDPELGTVRRYLPKFEYSPPVAVQEDQIVGW